MPKGDEIPNIFYMALILENLLLAFMCFFNNAIHAKQVLVGSYLRETKSSNWEIDVKEFRKKKNELRNSLIQAIIFLLFGFYLLLIPFILGYSMELKLGSINFLKAHVIVAVIYIIIVIFFATIFRFGKSYEDDWRELNKS